VVLVTHCNGEAWRWRRVKRKTDRDDALKLARLALLEQLPAVHVPSPGERQKRRLILHRRSIVSRRTQCRNAIRSIFSQQGLQLARGGKQWTKAGIEQLKQHARPLGDCGGGDLPELWRGRLHVELDLMAAIDQQLKRVDQMLDQLASSDARVKLLQTIKGVGPRVAEAVVSHLGDVKRFKSARQVAGYAGLVPKQIESGQMSRFGHITRRGPALLGSMLTESAWIVWRHNAWAQAWVNKISRGSKARRKIAMIALARRLLVILWAMLRDDQTVPPARHRAARLRAARLRAARLRAARLRAARLRAARLRAARLRAARLRAARLRADGRDLSSCRDDGLILPKL